MVPVCLGAFSKVHIFTSESQRCRGSSLQVALLDQLVQKLRALKYVVSLQ